MHHLLVTIGSHGDTHPFVAIGRRLRERGHRVTLAANGTFEGVVRGAGLEFEPIGTADDFQRALGDPDLWHPLKGFRAVFEKAVLPAMRPVYELIRKHYVPGETVVTAHAIAFGARVAQEKLGVPLATIHLAPAVFRSAHEPPVFIGNGIMQWLPANLNRVLYRVVMDPVADGVVKKPLNAFRGELGLRPIKRVIDAWWNSPERIVGLFPEWYAGRPADWPRQLRLTGFPLYDERGAHDLPADVDAFLAAGQPPVVFTFGSAMTHAREELAASVEACRLLKRRGLLLTRHVEQVPTDLGRDVMHVAYAPFSELLPRCAALVHHGGIGTTAQGLAAGVPQLIVPFAHDQPDNAARVRRLGCGAMLPSKRYRAVTVAAALGALLGDAHISARCREVAGCFVGHDPLEETCDLIEALRSVSLRDYR